MYKNISKSSPRRPEANHNSGNSGRNSPEPSFVYGQDGAPRKSTFSPRIKDIEKADP